MIGMFVKTLPLRSKLVEHDGFVDVLKQVHENLRAIDQHQDIPATVHTTNMFDILVSYQNPDFSYQHEIEVDAEASLTYYTMDTQYSRVPLLFNFFEVDGLLNLTLSYQSGRYEAATIDFVVSTFKKLMTEVEENLFVTLDQLKVAVLQNEQQEEVAFDFDF